MKTTWTAIRFLVLVAIVLVVVPAHAQSIQAVRTDSGYTVRVQGQHGVSTQRFPSAARMLADFARTGRHPHLSRVLLRHAWFPPAVVDSLTSGLERLAIESSDPDVRNAAVSTLVFMGRETTGSTERLVRIFAGSRDPHVRGNVLTLVPMASDTLRVVAFLREIAVRNARAPADDEPAKAITSLSLLGGRGQEALRQLHESRSVRSAEARMRLDALARRGYRAREAP